MAAGETFWFVEGLKRVFANQAADFGGTPNTIKVAFIKSAANGGHDPSVTDAYPTWGASGTTDLSAAEVNPGGTYSAGGKECANATATVNGAVLELDFDNPSAWEQDAANPTNCRWAIIYDNTAADKWCIAFYDLGSDQDFTTGEAQLTFGAPALTGTCDTP